MALIGSRADFVGHEMRHDKFCSECGELMPAGTLVLASIKDGKVKKIVCGEDCRQEFDARIWEVFAQRRSHGKA